MQKPSFSAIFPFERIDGDQRKKRLTPTVTETESDTAATEKRKRRTSTPPQQSDRTARISAQRKIPPAISVISKPQRLRDQKDEIEDPVRRQLTCRNPADDSTGAEKKNQYIPQHCQRPAERIRSAKAGKQPAAPCSFRLVRLAIAVSQNQTRAIFIIAFNRKIYSIEQVNRILMENQEAPLNRCRD